MRIAIIGPAHPYRGGGITTFNHRLAKEFQAQGHTCSIISFSMQYPSFLFPGKSQYTSEPAPENLSIRRMINSVHPINWLKVGRQLRQEKWDLVVVRFWLPLMGPAFGTILRLLKKNGYTKVVCIADNIIPHEHRPGDKPFTRYFLKACDAFITMSEKVLADLKTFTTGKPIRLVPHPLYDNFGEPMPKDEARKMLGLPAHDKLLLFFGFIRQYKGLDLLLQAMSDDRIRQEKIKLLVAGEFYEDEKPYLDYILQNNLQDSVILRTNFIPDNEVRLFLSAADCVVQPYRNATQSGVTPLAYHFEKPMIVTNVGGLPALVPHQKVGLVTGAQPSAIADAILRFYQLGEEFFIPHLRSEKQKYAWSNLTGAILEMVEKV